MPKHRRPYTLSKLIPDGQLDTAILLGELGQREGRKTGQSLGENLAFIGSLLQNPNYPHFVPDTSKTVKHIRIHEIMELLARLGIEYVEFDGKDCFTYSIFRTHEEANPFYDKDAELAQSKKEKAIQEKKERMATSKATKFLLPE